MRVRAKMKRQGLRVLAFVGSSGCDEAVAMKENASRIHRLGCPTSAPASFGAALREGFGWRAR